MGGTIEFLDSDYCASNQKLMKLDTSLESYFTNIIQPDFELQFDDLFQGDSRDIGTAELEQLCTTITNSGSENVLVTHGTDAAVATARHLKQQNFGNKKVVLTCSMLPLVGFAVSDAGFNLGFAIGSFASLHPGTYLASNGRFFDPDKASKNYDRLRFEEPQ